MFNLPSFISEAMEADSIMKFFNVSKLPKKVYNNKIA